MGLIDSNVFFQLEYIFARTYGQILYDRIEGWFSTNWSKIFHIPFRISRRRKVGLASVLLQSEWDIQYYTRTSNIISINRNRLSDVNGINVWVTSFSLGQIPEFIVHSLHLYLIEEADCPGKRKLVDNLSDANTKAILKEWITVIEPDYSIRFIYSMNFLLFFFFFRIRSDFNYLRIFVKLLATNEIHPKGLAHSWFMVLMRLVDIPQM